MPAFEAPSVELGNVPQSPTMTATPASSEISSDSSPEPPYIEPSPLFRALAMPPPEPEQPSGQDELERRLPGYRRIVIPRDLTLIELLKQSSGVTTDNEVLRIREAKLRVVAERVGLRRLNVLAPRLRNLTLDGSALSSLRDLGVGLTHLKVLSVNRCGLTTLDGVWGLGALRELYAAGNRIQDLQLLAALTKLQTLDLANNPILETGRLWMLGVCGALRRLTLSGSPASDEPDYRSQIAAALPMLVYLDERPLHTDVEYDIVGLSSGGSSSESDSEPETDLLQNQLLPVVPEPAPSSSQQEDVQDQDPVQDIGQTDSASQLQPLRVRRRPATTENAGRRPARPDLPRRPKTAVDRPNIDEPTRLRILNTLIEDDEWLCGGSKLTSLDAVCGNLARALRKTRPYRNKGGDAEQTMHDAARTAASEIPRAPRIDDWVKFTAETGIEIDIDFNNRPRYEDATKILDRLDQIERETQARFKEMDAKCYEPGASCANPISSLSYLNDDLCSYSNHSSLKSTSLGSYSEEANEIQSLSSERA